MGLILALWRRAFGSGGLRGLQAVCCIILVFLFEWLHKGMAWYFALITAILVYVFWSKGHYYYFRMGTESDKYIDEQEAKGRKPAMDWLVRPVNKLLGFEPRKVQYCFIGMFIRYFVWSLPVSVFVGWGFSACSFAIPFIYAGMFWVKLPKFWICDSETNWAEFFSGLIIGWALI